MSLPIRSNKIDEIIESLQDTKDLLLRLEVFKTIIKYSRQTGNSTALIKAAQETGGILVVSKSQEKAIYKHAIELFPQLNFQIINTADLARTDYMAGKLIYCPVFFDNSAIDTI